MAPYSVDLRQKILQEYESGERSQREIAEIFHVSISFMESLLRQFRATGQIAPKPHAGGPPLRVLTTGRANSCGIGCKRNRT